jgi:hypothetical protein
VRSLLRIEIDNDKRGASATQNRLKVKVRNKLKQREIQRHEVLQNEYIGSSDDEAVTISEKHDKA